MNKISYTAIPVLSQKTRIKWDPIRQKHMLLFPEGLLVLNQTAQEIIILCDGKHQVIDIVKLLSEKYQLSVETDVLDMLSRLVEKHLIFIE